MGPYKSLQASAHEKCLVFLSAVHPEKLSVGFIAGPKLELRVHLTS